MGREIVYCAICGERIPPEQFEKHQALKLESRHFCKTCVAESPHVPTLVTPGVVSPFFKPSGAPPRQEAVKHPPTRQGEVAAAPSSGRGGPLLVGAGLASIPIIVLAIVLFWPRGSAPVAPVEPAAPDAGLAERKRLELQTRAAESALDLLKQVRGLVDARKFDEALKVIDGYPPEFKETKAWKDVQESRAEVAKGRAAAPKRPWTQLFEEAQAAWKAMDYAKAKRLYLEGMETAPEATAGGNDHSRWQYGHFQLAEMFARDGALDPAFAHLKKLFSYRSGQGDTCKCQKNCIEELGKTETWKALRADPRYAAMMKALPPR